MSIRPDNLTLDKLLQGRLFRIPDYQRAYSWETKQRNDLFEDIKKLAKNPNNERHHFMSTVVCLQTKQKEEVGADEFGIFYIVDGQQRLTTLIILLKALAKALAKGDEIERKESSKLSELLVKENGRLILLQTNHDNKLLFRNYLTKGKIPIEEDLETSADKNIIRAFNECEKFVNEWNRNPNLNLISLLKLVKNRLDFIFYVLDDEGAVHTTFEVLNSRGLEVDWLDKCKSILMGIACEKLADASQEHIEQIHECWSKIYKTIGLKKIEGQEILRFAAALEDSSATRKISTAEKAMEFFREKCQNNAEYTIDVSQKFLDIAKELRKLVTDRRLKAVSKISHARLLAIAIKLNRVLNESEKQKVLNEWEKVTFRIFGLHRKDGRTKVGEYVRLARYIFQANANTLFDEINQKVANLGKEYPSSEIGKKIRETNCYEGWEDELIYFLYCYEEFLTKEYGGSISNELWVQVWNSSSTKTIEHIHPQTINDAWRGKLGIKKDYIGRQTQRLGNLIILPPSVNSIAGNKSFQDKKEIYKKHRGLKILEEVIALDDWDDKTLSEREDRLITWAQNEWA
ncbi:hypothetical protein NIES267_49470 [Calothrix parasitica NIES-267]|uniref:DUF262 domain-containing protein n=1 Tax=Calothrix parasitica NIES-267 TaxID=1973488 RepID=A0A1Z4LW21_9CYAN|nr:hypothetical protein NIES267_49470 [Calothrix parasitica NIES-267]